MKDSNGSSVQSNGPDFEQALRDAQQSGDFDFVLNTAAQSHRMLIDFRAAIQTATFAGKDSAAIAMGLNFLEKMVGQAAAQLNLLKQTERETRAAIKASDKPEAPDVA